MATKMKLKSGATADFTLKDNGDDSLTPVGVDSAGNTVELSTEGAMAWSSSDATVVSLDVADGPTANMKAMGPLGAAVITVVFTPTDTTQPALTGTLNVTTVAGPANDVKIVPGVPTTH